MASILDRVKNAVNAFAINDASPPQMDYGSYGAVSDIRPDRTRARFSNEKSIITSIMTRISVDCASVRIRHVRLDDQERYLEDIPSQFNSCLTLEANVDQAARMFRQDIFMTLCDKGVLAIVPIDTTVNPNTGSYDILTMRVGEIVKWMPDRVKVSVYNERIGKRQEIVVSKTVAAIVENPLYAIMNEPNSTLQRLIRKLNLLDSVDEASASGKMDLIIQLPYVIKSEARKQQAEQRRGDIEEQLRGSKYGIAYTDGTEKITQLNRPAENNMMTQIQYLTDQLYGQLGITAEVMNGTADEATMINYWNRTLEPMIAAVSEAMKRVFLTKTARSQHQSVEYFRDAFRLAPLDKLAEAADVLTRNEIVSSNEIRQALGLKPSKDAKADMLVNSNMPQGTALPDGSLPVTDPAADPTSVDDGATEDDQEVEGIMNSAFDNVDGMLDDLINSIGGGGG